MLDNGFLKELDERKRVVEVAHQWLKTPYHHAARIKGVGCDCLTLLAEVFTEAELVPRIDVPYYPKDWHLHRDAERYLDGLLGYTREIEGPPLPGDVVLWKFGRCYSHGAIVVKWPVVIHAYVGRNCIIEDTEAATWLNFIGENREESGKPRPRRFFSYWGR
jgi:cell wall-associated NlpC family hydrolase